MHSQIIFTLHTWIPVFLREQLPGNWTQGMGKRDKSGRFFDFHVCLRLQLPWVLSPSSPQIRVLGSNIVKVMCDGYNV